MNSSFLSIVCRAPRALPATSAEPRSSTLSASSMLAASRASWFSLILNSREGSRSGMDIGCPLLAGGHPELQNDLSEDAQQHGASRCQYQSCALISGSEVIYLAKNIKKISHEGITALQFFLYTNLITKYRA